MCSQDSSQTAWRPSNIANPYLRSHWWLLSLVQPSIPPALLHQGSNLRVRVCLAPAAARCHQRHSLLLQPVHATALPQQCAATAETALQTAENSSIWQAHIEADIAILSACKSPATPAWDNNNRCTTTQPVTQAVEQAHASAGGWPCQLASQKDAASQAAPQYSQPQQQANKQVPLSNSQRLLTCWPLQMSMLHHCTVAGACRPDHHISVHSLLTEVHQHATSPVSLDGYACAAAEAVRCTAPHTKHALPRSLLVKLVEAAASFLPQPLVLIHQLNDARLVHPVREGLVEVGAHVQPNVCAH